MSQKKTLTFVRRTKSVADRIRGYDARNLAAARIIVAERTRYERECLFLMMWADRVIARLGFETDKGEKAA
jgi:hypothetical protein